METDDLAVEYKPDKARKHWFLLGGIAILLTPAIVGLMLWHPWKQSGWILSPAVTRQITAFTPYQPELLPAGLQIDPTSVKFDGHLLLFRLNKSGASMVVTEQSSPPGLASGRYQSQKIDGVDGVAYLSRDQTRTFATFFANGRGSKPTMILVNTNDPFTTENFQDLLRGFRVVQ